MNPRPLGSGLPMTLMFVVGLLAVFIGERILGAGTGRTAFSWLGVALAVGALGWRFTRARSAAPDRRAVEGWVLGLYGVGLLALLLYFLQSDAGASVFGGPLSQKAPRLAVVLAALFPALLLCCLLPLALVEVAAAAMARAPVMETGRARSALYSGLGLAFVVVFAFASMYVATQADVTWDLSYFRTAKPGDATRKVIRGLNEPLQVSLFFPPANEVGEAVAQYFRDLSVESPQLLTVERLDQAVEPARARTLGVHNNGTIVLSRGERKEPLTVGLEIDRARGQLQRLDQEVQRRLLAVARPRRIVYFTTGHGERAESRPVPGETPRPSASRIRELLRAQNVDVRPLGVAEGLGSEVPRDASVVVVLGAMREFLPEELNALREYADRGGRLWVALEPGGPDFKALLEPMGIQYVGTPLANDQRFFRTTRQQSDRANLGSDSFSSHPSVTSLAAMAGQAPVGFMGAAAIDQVQPLPGGIMQDLSVRAHGATFADPNGNFTLDAGETRRTWPLVIAVEKPAPAGKEAMRAVVLADADAVSDLLLENMGNAYLAVDTLRWLTGEEAIAGTVSSEEDTPIQHTREQDVAWFYATVFLGPALVLAVGFVTTRRRGRRAPRAPVAAGGER
ncbi:motility-associated ABC transporter substrate-binding family protein [Pyxidicoccus xibeiensis]|uniref:Gldg family protein n=1 Tax=Pyxidicoccus xibeiensis TaxID=2906759 RepID=UPI0020A7682C|nr:Gldg family protein [Pyxidicoccus xibeiensis]MCP3138761.1 GldG family protein [Pyxidicoccus xibeiensis]